MKSLKLATPSRTMSSMSSRPDVAEVGDDHVQPIIDAGLALRLLPPRIERRAHLRALRLNGEVDNRRRPADRRRARARFIIVRAMLFRRRAYQDACAHRCHPATPAFRSRPPPCALQDRSPRARLDRLALNQHIGGESLLRSHNLAISDQHSHRVSSSHPIAGRSFSCLGGLHSSRRPSAPPTSPALRPSPLPPS